MLTVYNGTGQKIVESFTEIISLGLLHIGGNSQSPKNDLSNSTITPNFL